MPIFKSFSFNPYKNTILGEKIISKSSIKIAFLDIDSTLTGDPEIIAQTRSLLEQKKYIIVFVTSRTEEMLMSSLSYNLTIKQGFFDRPSPNLLQQNDHYTYIIPEKHIPKGLLDPDIIAASSGTQILVKQSSGAFIQDEKYQNNFDQDSGSWRTKTIQTIDIINKLAGKQLAHLALIDQPDAYQQGVINVAPPRFRIEIIFHKANDMQKFLIILEKLLCSYKKEIVQLANMSFTDDSKPESGKYVFYVTPKNSGKTEAVNIIAQSICNAYQIETSKLNLLFAGDSFPDLIMGLTAFPQATSEFLVVGGSRLTKPLSDANITSFAYQNLTPTKQMLQQTTTQGYFNIKSHAAKRTLILGELAFPNRKAVESVHSYLTEKLLN